MGKCEHGALVLLGGSGAGAGTRLGILRCEAMWGGNVGFVRKGRSVESHLWSFPGLVPRVSTHPSSEGCWGEGGGVLILHAENAHFLSSVSFT